MLRGMGDLAKMGGVLKQAMEMKNRIEELKEKLADEEIEGSAGGGMVNVVVNGRMDVLSIRIDPEVVDKNDVEMLETLVRAAINEGLEKTRQMVKDRMAEISGGLDIPGITP